jgi:hypothetical protein
VVDAGIDFSDSPAQVKRYLSEVQSLEYVIEAALIADSTLARSSGRQMRFASILLTKALAHCLSIRKLCPDPSQGNQLYDYSSIAVLTRAVCESYITFRYVAVEPSSETCSELHRLLMDYHRRHKQSTLMKLVGVGGSTAEHGDVIVRAAGNALLANPEFKRWPDRQQRKWLESPKEMHVDAASIAERAGIDRAIWIGLYGFLSQFVHSTPMAIVHVAELKGGSAQSHSQLSLLLAWCSGILAKFVIDARAFPMEALTGLPPRVEEAVLLQASVLETLSPSAFDVDQI